MIVWSRLCKYSFLFVLMVQHFIRDVYYVTYSTKVSPWPSKRHHEEANKLMSKKRLSRVFIYSEDSL